MPELKPPQTAHASEDCAADDKEWFCEAAEYEDERPLYTVGKGNTLAATMRCLSTTAKENSEDLKEVVGVLLVGAQVGLAGGRESDEPDTCQANW